VTLLPIVDRELRVSARKPVTFWLRIVAALIGLLVGIGCVIMNEVSGGGTAAFGSVLFGILSWLSLGAALAAGLFLTSDCLSEEKREGTLGLLFLTDLRGYDVVAGKLLVTSLRASYALLAIFPILAITLLMGGVAGAQFWKASLALLNALFCSLCAGLLVSAVSRDAQRALAALVLLLILVIFGGAAADSISAAAHHRGFSAYWALSSPAYPFTSAGHWGRSPYWKSLAMTHGMGWAFFLAACVLVTRTWQERDRKDSAAGLRTIQYGSRQHRDRLRSKLLGHDVVLWLACRERWQAFGLWAITILCAGGFVALLLAMEQEAWMLWQYISWFFLLFFYLWAASQACRFFIQARRSGLLELLLVTPIDDRQLIRGQWRAILRQFGLPIFLLTALIGIAAWCSQSAMQRMFAGMPVAAPTAGTTNSAGAITSTSYVVSVKISPGSGRSNSVAGPPMPAQSWSAYLAPSLAATMIAIATVVANFLALFWFGMWMGMTSRSANTATAKTFLFVHIIPLMCISFASGIGVSLLMMSLAFRSGSTQSPRVFAWYPLISVICTGVLTLAKDIGFMVLARQTLYRRLRTLAARGDEHKWAAVVPVAQSQTPASPMTSAANS
jgi:ABC-type transport system involved in multi-copper enzyme maturation permease subunit